MSRRGVPVALQVTDFLIVQACRVMPPAESEANVLAWTGDARDVFHDPEVALAAVRVSHTLRFGLGLFVTRRAHYGGSAVREALGLVIGQAVFYALVTFGLVGLGLALLYAGQATAPVGGFLYVIGVVVLLAWSPLALGALAMLAEIPTALASWVLGSGELCLRMASGEGSTHGELD